MKSEILKKLETLLETENILSVQREFKQLSAQFRSLAAHGIAEMDESEEDHEDDAHEDDVNPEHQNIGAQKPDAEADEKQSELKADTAIEISPTLVEADKSSSEKSDAKETDQPIEEKSESQPESDTATNDLTTEPTELEVRDSDAPESREEETHTNEEKTEPITESATPEATPVTEDKKEDEEVKQEVTETAEAVDAEKVPVTEDVANTEEVVGEEHEVEAKQDPTDQAIEKDPSESITMAEAIVLFNTLSSKFKERTEKQREVKKREEKETVITAKHLLEELHTLVENEENIAKAFNGFNAIQDKWKSLPKVSNDAYRDLNAEYNKHAEKFFYNINIYKELKELDLKHNLEQKLLVLEDQRKLQEMNDIRRMEVEVRLNQDRWNEIGPTFKEEWDKIKDEFWDVTRHIYKKIQDFYNQRREQQNKNLELKEKLLEKINQISALELKSHKKWQEKTEEVIEIQKEWKMIGYVPKDKTGVWKDFRKASDAFFDNKRAFYKDIRDEQNENRDQKMELLRQAEELKESEDWNAASSALIQLQNQWKTIGPAHQRDENRMWRKFRQACDHFFQKRKSQRSEEAVEFENNLKAKNELISEIEKFEPGSDRNANIEGLKEFAEKWRAIGHVPFKLKDKVNKDYKKVLDEKYGLLKIDRKEKEKIRFEQKLEDIKETDNNDFLIRKEQDNIRAKISKLNTEAIQLENNIGFFANSKGAEKLKAEVEKKIEKVKNEIDVLKERLSMLREAI